MFVAGDVLQIRNSTRIFATKLLFLWQIILSLFPRKIKMWRFTGARNDLSHQTKIGFVCSD